MKRYFCLLVVLLVFMSACVPTIPLPPATGTLETDLTPASDLVLTPVELKAGFGARGSWIEIYFTNPFSPLANDYTGGVDGPLVEAIDAAHLSIDAAAYSLSLNSVRYALINAHKRGVQVRMVMESDNMDRSDPQALIEAGISVLGDRREGLMHDKFMVIDRSEVWMGSMNFTDSGTYEDNNNLVRIRSAKVAENYTTEFEEMFVDDLFVPDVLAQTPNPTVTVNGTRVDTMFSPDDGVGNRLATLLSSAQQSIYFLAFSFTLNDLGDIIRTKAEEGLLIKGVMEEEQVKSNQGTEYDPFKQAGLNVFLDGNQGQMHHKVFIIDEEIVVLGSYNFSQSAEQRNDENIVIIYNKVVAQQYLQEFERVLAHAQK